jgi:hypothetical protein
VTVCQIVAASNGAAGQQTRTVTNGFLNVVHCFVSRGCRDQRAEIESGVGSGARGELTDARGQPENKFIGDAFDDNDA